ncbi:DUF2169 domain-containing protein [Jiella sp. MQZ9-1]|uniref:DUF2169 domain-containing protein n=1 Tax=Jiella flava TaxID=2816857 RepID=UPI001E352065|nr:DUF2169 domain-containing protein [Jiella flava]
MSLEKAITDPEEARSPEDFDYRFYQCAPPDLIAEPWLKGDEPFELENLIPGYPRVKGHLPGLGFEIEIDQGAGPGRGPVGAAPWRPVPSEPRQHPRRILHRALHPRARCARRQ